MEGDPPLDPNTPTWATPPPLPSQSSGDDADLRAEIGPPLPPIGTFARALHGSYEYSPLEPVPLAPTKGPSWLRWDKKHEIVLAFILALVSVVTGAAFVKWPGTFTTITFGVSVVLLCAAIVWLVLDVILWPKSFSVAKRFGVVAICSVAAAIVIWHFLAPAMNIETAKLGPMSKNIVNATPTKLLTLCNGYTARKCDRLFSEYSGKWVRWSGVVDGVSAGSNPTVFLTMPFPPNRILGRTTVIVDFNSSQHEELLRVREGDRITVLGKIASVYMDIVSLEDSELLNNDTVDRKNP